MHSAAKRILRFLVKLILAALLVVILLAALILQGFRTQMPECEKGPLIQVETCAKDHSTFTWMGSGWWYSDATGMPSEHLIAQINASKTILTLSSGESLEKINCATISDSNGEDFCYATQRLSGNGNSRIFLALWVSKDYKHARFFEGARYMLLKGRPTEVGRDIYPGIPKVASDNLGG